MHKYLPLNVCILCSYQLYSSISTRRRQQPHLWGYGDVEVFWDFPGSFQRLICTRSRHWNRHRSHIFFRLFGCSIYLDKLHVVVAVLKQQTDSYWAYTHKYQETQNSVFHSNQEHKKCNQIQFQTTKRDMKVLSIYFGILNSTCKVFVQTGPLSFGIKHQYFITFIILFVPLLKLAYEFCVTAKDLFYKVTVTINRRNLFSCPFY